MLCHVMGGVCRTSLVQVTTVCAGEESCRAGLNVGSSQCNMDNSDLTKCLSGGWRWVLVSGRFGLGLKDGCTVYYP